MEPRRYGYAASPRSRRRDSDAAIVLNNNSPTWLADLTDFSKSLAAVHGPDRRREVSVCG